MSEPKHLVRVVATKLNARAQTLHPRLQPDADGGKRERRTKVNMWQALRETRYVYTGNSALYTSWKFWFSIALHCLALNGSHVDGPSTRR